MLALGRLCVVGFNSPTAAAGGGVEDHGQRQHQPSGDILDRDVNAHQVHAASQRTHHQRTDQRAKDAADAARRRHTTDISGGDGVQLEEGAAVVVADCKREVKRMPESAESKPIDPKTT